RVKGSFDGAADSAVLHLKKCTMSLAGESPVLELQTTGPLDFNLKERRLESAGGAHGEIVRVRLAALPLAWIAPFCPAVDISGGPITGELSIVQGEGDQFSMLSPTPLQAEGVSIVRAGR